MNVLEHCFKARVGNTISNEPLVCFIRTKNKSTANTAAVVSNDTQMA